MHDALSRPAVLTQEQYDHVEILLSTHFAKLYSEMIGLAASCVGAAMVLAIIVVVALRA